ncbi:hypothetical protein CDD80_6765 [Ophiocordyceps camponoti-rufipedis]|uniref:tyrosinase n=1 Tax=Ophiocordyceps camponoti-rufipedis TaxID=2004952 RepID=A0A2C5ZBU4_9HYPO|nr:hypothetical protein CDD80_6765 [Ophiocordyceps camponoti-rufipedis]
MYSHLSTITLVLGSALLASAARRNGSDIYAITGFKVAGDTIPVRRDINDVQEENGPQWDLYIQALNVMQNADTHDARSHFQVAGLHGFPLVSWNNTGPRTSAPDQWGGYCPHGEPIFLTWHRAYTLMFEQIMVENAREIAKTYPNETRDDYIQAAEVLRQPYWDWASDSDVPPSLVPANLSINTPQGRMDVQNPLAGYKFPENALKGEFGDFNPGPGGRQAVARCVKPLSFPESANSRMATQNWGEMIYDAFIYSRNFNEFATSRGGGLSLEEIHNAVHAEATCFGHFANPPYAAFDPIFPLHHANVDRFFAYWQVLNGQQAEFVDMYRGGSRWDWPEGQMVSPVSPLAPFWQANGMPHSPRTMTPISRFGYTYDGLPFIGTPYYEMRVNVRRILNERYSKSRPGSPQSLRVQPQPQRVFLARLTYLLEEVEGPHDIEVYVCNKFAGQVDVPIEPRKGPSGGSVPLAHVIDSCPEGQRNATDIAKNISLRVVQMQTSEVLPTASWKSLKVSIDDLEEVPPESKDELPEVRDRHNTPAEVREQKL